DVVQLPMGPSRLPLLDSKLLTGCHDVGLPIHVWTVNERSSMESLLERGVDGIMSDDPEVLRSVFSARGIWRTEQH
ncbi:MAG TPA: glycerophosphodiester phosphodiesterase family protein, partial [Actinomycetes bacterium]|nr:glycerophosphodiester phosphodiesterase family protein [Actinomycetes bacterium]